MKKQDEINKAVNIIYKKKVVKRAHGEFDFWTVEGNSSEYFIHNQTFCLCDQFIHRCLKTKGKKCYHLIATNIAKNYEVENISKEEIFDYLGVD